MTAEPRARTDIVEWLRTAIAAELQHAPGSIDPDRPLTFYGLDSLTAATLATDLAEWLGADLPTDLLLARATISSLADRLAAAPKAGPPAPPPRASDRIDYAALDYARPPRLERLLKTGVRALVRITSAVTVEGIERLPAEGPVLLASNHLHILDALWMAAVLPRRTVFLVAEEFERKFLVGRLLNTGRAIYIARGRADRDALDRALAVLRAGGALGVAPEGRLSRTGGLIRGQIGIAYLASEARVPVWPVVAWGQEQAGRSWLRLRRVRVQIRFGPPVDLSSIVEGPRLLERGADEVMKALARLLPAAYRGEYQEPDGRRPVR